MLTYFNFLKYIEALFEFWNVLSYHMSTCLNMIYILNLLTNSIAQPHYHESNQKPEVMDIEMPETCSDNDEP